MKNNSYFPTVFRKEAGRTSHWELRDRIREIKNGAAATPAERMSIWLQRQNIIWRQEFRSLITNIRCTYANIGYKSRRLLSK